MGKNIQNFYKIFSVSICQNHSLELILHSFTRKHKLKSIGLASRLELKGSIFSVKGLYMPAHRKGFLLTTWIMYQLVGRNPFQPAGIKSVFIFCLELPVSWCCSCPSKPKKTRIKHELLLPCTFFKNKKKPYFSCNCKLRKKNSIQRKKRGEQRRST